jgi:DNA-binding IclR family transcriptional regulator
VTDPGCAAPAVDDELARAGPVTVHSVLAALDLLDCFTEDEELGVTQIARRLGIAKSTAHRLLSTLCARGVVERDPVTSHYRLGLHLYELGQLAQERVPMRRVALPLLAELRVATGQTVHLSIADGPDVVFIERLQTLGGTAPPKDSRRRAPLHTTSSGRAMAAFNPVLALTREQAGLEPLPGSMITTAEEWHRCLADVRRAGFAVTESRDRNGVASIAAPVRDRTGNALAALSVAGPAEAIMADVAGISQSVIKAADKLAARLGW